MNGLCYEIDELFNEAIITGVPVIIVEGIDDISIYEEISHDLPFDVEVYAIEHIKGFSEGCEQVIRAIENLNDLPNICYTLSDHVLGIIDKDVRDYRNESPDVEPLLTLRYYSIESHFISAVKVKKIFNISTKASQSLINDQLTHLIMNAVEGKLLDLYYFSLEALRNSLEPQYVAGFTYSDSYGRVDNAATRRNVLSKKENLDAFASLHGITPSVDTLKKISKGKWLIDSFAKELLVSMNELKDKCAEELIISCRSCASESYDKCLYRVSSGFTKVTIKNLLLSDVEGAEVQYILDRMYDFKRADTGSECHTLLN